MATAIYPGSFDPVTKGHLDLIERASKLFDHLNVCILNNSSKKSPLFSIDERVIMLKDAVKDLPNVSVETYDGLLIEYAKKCNSNIIVRGLREMTDFEIELQMAQVNKEVSGNIETLFLAADPKYSNVSSSVVREFAKFGVPVGGFVPENVLMKLKEKMNMM